MAAGNRDIAASLGMPAAVHEHPGFKQHLFPGKSKPTSHLTLNAGRSSQRGIRLSRRARAA
jgi:hypothetical protein